MRQLKLKETTKQLMSCSKEPNKNIKISNKLSKEKKLGMKAVRKKEIFTKTSKTVTKKHLMNE